MRTFLFFLLLLAAPAYAAEGVTVIKIQDEAVTGSTQLQDDDELQFRIGRFEAKTFEFVLFGSSEHPPQGGILYTLEAPRGAVVKYTNSCYQFIPEKSLEQMTSFAGGDFGAQACFFASPIGSIRISGSVVSGARKGMVKLRWAQAWPSATPTTVQAGSYLIVHEEE